MSQSAEVQDQIIKRLPPEISNKIAAGEVVQRPASVLKELLDNSVDSGASSIKAIIDNAGRSMIQVIDNGCGMSQEDLPLCFERHATSKIHRIEDLNNLRTMGFRGEAMASIASVSQVHIRSKRVEDASGYEYEISGGDAGTIRPIATENGTSVSVRNLFFNVPARRAFLKTDTTEFRHCLLIFQQVVLANPTIAFELIADRDSVYKLPQQDIPERVTMLFGKSYKASLLTIDEPAGFVRIYGFLTDPKLTKKTRGEQFLFVNGRPFSHRFLIHQVLEQYRPWIRQDEYPFFAIFYELDPSLVDVNVHPSKMEVRFEDERTILGLTRSVIKRALNQRFSIPEIDTSGTSADFINTPFRDLLPALEYHESGFPVQKIPSRINYDKTAQIYGSRVNKGVLSLNHDAKKPEYQKAVGFWQLHDQFILSQTMTGLFLVDQHAAHKRILYEKALQAAESGLAGTQQLLFPIIVEFSASDFATLKSLLNEIQRLGFNISLMSGNSAMVQGVPADIGSGDEQHLLESILQQYQNYNGPLKLDKRQKLALAYASKIAIPKGKKLNFNEMEALVDHLFACEHPYFDPLQKPTIIYISLDEIRSRFR